MRNNQSKPVARESREQTPMNSETRTRHLDFMSVASQQDCHGEFRKFAAIRVIRGQSLAHE